MCRRNQLIGMVLLGFGAGLLVASFFESLFFCGCLGLITMTGGVIVIRKK